MPDIIGTIYTIEAIYTIEGIDTIGKRTVENFMAVYVDF